VSGLDKKSLALNHLRKHGELVVDDVRSRFERADDPSDADPTAVKYGIGLRHLLYGAIELARTYAGHKGTLAAIPNRAHVAARIAVEGISALEPDLMILIVALYLLQSDERYLDEEDEEFVRALVEDVEANPPPPLKARTAP
jgi:hypothetical protein